MDKKANDKPRFNIFDILIIFAIIACIAAIGLRFYFMNNTGVKSDSTTIKFEVYGISKENALEFSARKKIYLQSNDEEIGKFEVVEANAAKIEAFDKSGNVTMVDHPDKQTVSGTATVIGKWGDNGFMLNGTQLLSLGTQIYVYTDRNMFSMTVIEISEKQ